MANNTTQLTIYLLGTPQALIAGEALSLHNQKARALLYYLAATGRPHTREYLATLFWSESPESNARHSLRSSLYHIRQALLSKGAEHILVADGDIIHLKLDNDACDVVRFRQLVKEGGSTSFVVKQVTRANLADHPPDGRAQALPTSPRQGSTRVPSFPYTTAAPMESSPARIESQEGHEIAFIEAISLYRGPFLQGFTLTDAPLFEEWLRNEACELDQAYLLTLQRLASWAEQQQDWNQAIPYLQRIVQHDPLSEEAQQRLIDLFIRTGAIGQAIRQYHLFEAELQREFGLSPSPTTKALISFVSGDHAHNEALPIRRGTNPGQSVAVLLQSANDTDKSPLFDELINSLHVNAQTANFLRHLYDVLAPNASIYEKMRLTSALGQVHQSLGHLDEATSWHQRHLELARQASDLAAQSTAHYDLGELALVANDYHAAAEAAKAGLAAAIPAAHPQRIALSARGHWLVGAALAMEGSDLPSAENHLQQAVAAHRLANNMRELCGTLFELGNVAAQRGELKHALERYQEAARIAEAAHEHYFLALAHNNFAYHSLLLGQLAAAQQALAKGNTLAETYEMFGALLHLNSTEGEIHLYLGEWDAAREAFQRGLGRAIELCNLERQAGYQAGLALVARGERNLVAATELLTDALTLISGRGYWHMYTRIQLWLAETLLLGDQFSQAEPYLQAALHTAQAHGRTLLLMQGERLQARLQAMRYDWDSANALFAKTLTCAFNLNLSLEVARSQAAWGEALLRYGDASHDGDALLLEAHKVFAAHGARAELESIPLRVNTQ